MVLEGVDRCGKTTQIQRVAERLPGSLSCGFPDRTSPLGTVINEYLLGKQELQDRAIHLMFSANRWERSAQIVEWVNSGKTVLCDRYAYSGVCYTAAKGYDIEWCKGTDRELPMPDLCCYLQVEPAELHERSQYGNERYEKVEFQKKVAEKYLELLQGRSECILIKGDRPVEDITNEIISYIHSIEITGNLKKLW